MKIIAVWIPPTFFLSLIPCIVVCAVWWRVAHAPACVWGPENNSRHELGNDLQVKLGCKWTPNLGVAKTWVSTPFQSEQAAKGSSEIIPCPLSSTSWTAFVSSVQRCFLSTVQAASLWGCPGSVLLNSRITNKSPRGATAPEALWFCLLTELPAAGCEAARQTSALLTTNWELVPSSHWVLSRGHASTDNAGPVSSAQLSRLCLDILPLAPRGT